MADVAEFPTITRTPTAVAFLHSTEATFPTITRTAAAVAFSTAQGTNVAKFPTIHRRPRPGRFRAVES